MVRDVSGVVRAVVLWSLLATPACNAERPVPPDVEVEDTARAPRVDQEARQIEGTPAPRTGEVTSPTSTPACTEHSDCDDGDVCSTGRCEQTDAGERQCVYEYAVCPDSELSCLQATCDRVTGCGFELGSSDTCCFTEALGRWGFEQGPGASDLNEGQSDAVWHVTETLALVGETSLRFGVPGASRFGGNERVSGAYTLPPIALPNAPLATATFHVWLDVEEGDSWDVLTLHATTESASLPLWSKDYDNVTLGEWNTVEVPLYALAGHTTELTFSFDSVDHTHNDTLGVFIDEVWVKTDCDAHLCQASEDCVSDIRCTSASCIDGQCHYTAQQDCCDNDLGCDDGDTCTIDRCELGACVHQPVDDPMCCNTHADCDDGLPCTVDSCNFVGAFRCAHEPSTEPGCCATAADCDDGDTCSIDRCVDNSCETIVACCEEDSDCDDGDDLCTLDSCLDGRCRFAAKDTDDCCEDVPFVAGFESPAHGWTFTGGGSGCQWQISPYGHQSSGQGALYYGNLNQGNFDCGTTSGEAWSPDFTLPVDATYVLSANLWLGTEGGSSSDVLELWVRQGNTTWMLWQKSAATQVEQWQTLTFDLSAFAGHDLRVGWRFDSGDGGSNDLEGVYIDDVKLTSNCIPPTCNSSWDCDDGIAFTVESCESQRCNWLSLPAP